MSTLLALSASEEQSHQLRLARFDSDSDWVGIDNRTSACISDRESDFKPGTLRPSGRVIKGFGGQLFHNVMVGTLVWRIEDNTGRTHVFTIPGSFYVPEGKVRLFCPQHFAQTRTGPSGKEGTRLITTADTQVLEWNHGKSTLTCPIDPAINVSSFPLATGYTAFEAFATDADVADDLDPLVMPVHLIPLDDDDDAEDSSDGVSHDTQDPHSPFFLNSGDALPPRDFGAPLTTPFDLTEDTPTTELEVDTDEEVLLNAPLPAQLLRWHHCFNHISFAKLQQMARRGIIPKALAKCDVPICSACLYGKATRRAWRTKAQPKPKRPKNPGDVVSVDQMTSPTAGLIAQMSGFLTKKRYKYATVVC